MNISYQLAKSSDIDTLLCFYNDVIENQKYDKYSPKWTKDIYPSISDIENHVLNNRLYMGYIDSVLVCCAALQLHDDPIYEGINFKVKENIAVIHLLAVKKEYRGQNIAKEFVKYLIEEARPYVKAIHLDVVGTNLRADNLYKACGFTYIDTREVYYEDTGKISANIYEYIY